MSDIVSFYRFGTSLSDSNETYADLNHYLNDGIDPDQNLILNSMVPEEIDEFKFQPVKIDIVDQKENTFFFEINPKYSFYSNGDDVINFLVFLQKKGIIEVELDATEVPSLTYFKADVCYLKWKIILRTPEARENIEEIFEWSGGDLGCKFIESPFSKDDLELQPLPIPTHESSNDGLVDPALVKRVSQYENKEHSTIRIDTCRVDKLVDLVSELVINQGAIRTQMQSSNVLPGSSLDIAVSELNQLTQELQENVMAMRAHPIKAVFQRMNRIVREAARLSGKHVVFHIEGEEAEIDRSILEKLSEPLMHLIRNAIDHGLEEPVIRKNSKKNNEGNWRVRKTLWY
ncbi:hypothetical protein [Gluconobacter sp. DsW_058]|uniref:hypothetical protein n=1 Tax=Gluconobacter sp. DsW_058 TaxID=1511210 RepID=UPI00117AF97E|nr:hypothetical protein [Gluconobacter sp. DsW_058]